jgi:hypothetical protein
MFSKIKSVKLRLPLRFFNMKIKSSIKETQTEKRVEDYFETYDKVPLERKKEFYEEYRDSIMILDSNRKMRYWYAFHSLPAILFIPKLMSFLWIYQIFWSGTLAGLGMVSYDLYSDRKEKNALDIHIIVRY